MKGRRKKEEGKTKNEENIIIFIEQFSINFEAFLFSFFFSFFVLFASSRFVKKNLIHAFRSDCYISK